MKRIVMAMLMLGGCVPPPGGESLTTLATFGRTEPPLLHVCSIDTGMKPADVRHACGEPVREIEAVIGGADGPPSECWVYDNAGLTTAGTQVPFKAVCFGVVSRRYDEDPAHKEVVAYIGLGTIPAEEPAPASAPTSGGK